MLVLRSVPDTKIFFKINKLHFLLLVANCSFVRKLGRKIRARF